jgi:hypothetical protein
VYGGGAARTACAGHDEEAASYQLLKGQVEAMFGLSIGSRWN